MTHENGILCISQGFSLPNEHDGTNLSTTVYEAYGTVSKRRNISPRVITRTIWISFGERICETSLHNSPTSRRSPSDLSAFAQELGLASYRARQIRRWIDARGAASFAEMTDLPKALREQLGARARSSPPRLSGRIRPRMGPGNSSSSSKTD